MTEKSPERVMLSRERLARAAGDRWSESELSEAMALLKRAEGRFPPGVRTIPAELVKAIQKERLLAAMADAVTQVGFNALTVQDVLSRARVSRPTFYELFVDKEACFLAAFDEAAARMEGRIELAVSGAGPAWQDRLRAGLAELLRFIVEEPEDAHMVIVEARASSASGRRRRDELLERFAACIGSLSGEGADGNASPIVAAGVVGGVESVLYTRVQRGETEQLDALLPSLTYFSVSTIGRGSWQSVEPLSG